MADNAENGLLRWLAVQEEASEWQRTYPDWRRGQALFNALRLMDPPLAEQIRGTDLDPFHNDSPERLQSFAQAVMTRVIPPGSELTTGGGDRG